MPFVNEYISAADMLTYRIREIDQGVNIHRRTNSDSWTIYRDRSMYLRRVGKPGWEEGGGFDWTFFWHEWLIWVEIDLISCFGNRGGPGGSEKLITKLCLMGGDSNKLPPVLALQRKQIIEDIYQALLAYKDGGVNASQTTYELKLKVSPAC